LAWHGNLPVLEYDEVAAFISIFLPSASGAVRRARRSQKAAVDVWQCDALGI